MNKQVRKAEDKQRRTEFQSKMDLTNMDKSQHPIAKLFKVGVYMGRLNDKIIMSPGIEYISYSLFNGMIFLLKVLRIIFSIQNLDLTTENRRLIHEGPLTWRIQHRKVVGKKEKTIHLLLYCTNL